MDGKYPFYIRPDHRRIGNLSITGIFNEGFVAFNSRQSNGAEVDAHKVSAAAAARLFGGLSATSAVRRVRSAASTYATGWKQVPYPFLDQR